MKSQTKRVANDPHRSDTGSRPLIGVSACLLGQEVRFDGGHKHNRYVTGSLAEFLDFAPQCPEMAIGLGAPRPAIQLREEGDDVRLVENRCPENDITDAMHDYAESIMPQLSELDGFLFKKGSPTCGVFRVPVVVNEDGYRRPEGRGLFAEAFTRRYPLVPVEEEGRLNDPGLRENFFERVYAWRRWKQIPDAQSNVQGLFEFHARHKLLLMARGGSYYQDLGRLIAGTRLANLAERRQQYIERFMEVMALRSDPGRHVNVLLHILGYLKTTLGGADKQELLGAFEAYRQRQTPLITPLTLLRHHLRVHPQPYIERQHYLDPFPAQLALRSVI